MPYLLGLAERYVLLLILRHTRILDGHNRVSGIIIFALRRINATSLPIRVFWPFIA